MPKTSLPASFHSTFVSLLVYSSDCVCHVSRKLTVLSEGLKPKKTLNLHKEKQQLIIQQENDKQFAFKVKSSLGQEEITALGWGQGLLYL